MVTRRFDPWRAVIYFVLFIIMLATLYPIIYVVSMSISTPDAVATRKVWLLPVGFTLRSYKVVFANPGVYQAYFNTIWYTVVGTLLNVVMTMLAAYPLSRRELVGRSKFMVFIAVTMFFSGGLVPQFMLVNWLKLYNTRWSIVLPAMLSAWNTVIARVFFQSTIPDALVESAKIDGCNDVKILLRIAAPLSMPIVAVIALFSAVGFWNSYFQPVLYLSDASLHPMTIYLQKVLIQNDLNTSMGGMDLAMGERMKLGMQVKYALIVVTILPIVFVYPFAQKYFTQGVMIGAIKE